MSQAYYEDMADWLVAGLLIKEDIEEDLKDPDYQFYCELNKEKK